MTTSDTLAELADRLFEKPITRDRAIAALRDAFELGQLAATPPKTAAAPRTPLGQHADPEQRPGLMVQAAHVITAEKVAEHGPEALINAWTMQMLRQLGANGGNPALDASVSITGLPDGAIAITAEGRVFP